MAKLSAVKHLERYGVSTEAARDIFAGAISLNDLAKHVERATNGGITTDGAVTFWKTDTSAVDSIGV